MKCKDCGENLVVTVTDWLVCPQEHVVIDNGCAKAKPFPAENVRGKVQIVQRSDNRKHNDGGVVQKQQTAWEILFP